MFAWFEREILNLPANEYLTLYGLSLGGFFLFGYLAFAAFRRFRHMDATATSRIRSAAQGQVELKGLGEWMPGGELHSPFSKHRCLWYHCTIERKNRNAKRSTWTNIRNELSTELFRLVDETGECVIDPEGAHVVAEVTRSWYGASDAECNRPPAEFSGLFRVGGGDYRFCERLIRPAATLYALGWLKTHYNNPAEAHIDDQVVETIRHWKLQPGKYLHQFDHDASGNIVASEWPGVRAAARRQIITRLSAAKHHHHVMSRPPEKRLPYIISAMDELTLVRRKKLQAYGATLGAFLLFAVLVLISAVRSPLPV